MSRNEIQLFSMAFRFSDDNMVILSLKKMLKLVFHLCKRRIRPYGPRLSRSSPKKRRKLLLPTSTTTFEYFRFQDDACFSSNDYHTATTTVEQITLSIKPTIIMNRVILFQYSKEKDRRQNTNSRELFTFCMPTSNKNPIGPFV